MTRKVMEGKANLVPTIPRDRTISPPWCGTWQQTGQELEQLLRAHIPVHIKETHRERGW